MELSGQKKSLSLRIQRYRTSKNVLLEMTKSCKQFRHLFNLKNHDIVIAYLLLAAEPKPLWSFLASFLIFADH
jgi:hypothetical protein